MNPAMQTRWYAVKNSKRHNCTVVGIWGYGVGHNYTVASYELKWDSINKIQNVTAEKMMQLIRDGILKPI